MPADRSMQVDVRGLADFQRELRRLDMAKALRDANREVAEPIASEAAARARALGGVAAHVAGTIKAAAEQRRSKVTLGGNQNPEAMGAEFGGQGRPTTQQFRPHRGREGYFLYPTVRDRQEQTAETYERAVMQLARKAFPN